MEGVDVWGRSTSSSTNKHTEDVNLRVLKTGDIMTGNLLMSGNHVIGLPLDISQIVDSSEAPSYAVVESRVREMINEKVTELLAIDGSNGMASNLNMNNNKIINCSNPTFRSDVATKFYVDNRKCKNGWNIDGNTLQADGIIGSMNNHDVNIVRNNSTMIRILDYTIDVRQNIGMNGRNINNIRDPIFPQDAASKNYVDNKKCLSGYIPLLSENEDCLGFRCTASSELTDDNAAWRAFSNSGEWVSSNENENFWIRIMCPEPITVWRFKLAGRRDTPIIEQIYNWKFEGSNDNNVWKTLYTATNEYIDQTNFFQILDNKEEFQSYRIFALKADVQNSGISSMQLYTYNM